MGYRQDLAWGILWKEREIASKESTRDRCEDNASKAEVTEAIKPYLERVQMMRECLEKGGPVPLPSCGSIYNDEDWLCLQFNSDQIYCWMRPQICQTSMPKPANTPEKLPENAEESAEKPVEKPAEQAELL